MGPGSPSGHARHSPEPGAPSPEPQALPLQLGCESGPSFQIRVLVTFRLA